MPATTAETIVDVADRLFAAIEKSDAAAVDRLWSNDITVWRVGARRDNDKARALRVIDWFITATTRRRYEILDRRLFEGGFVQQHILHATGRAGQSISIRVCIVIKVGTTGLIDRIDEYFDPAEIAPLIDQSAIASAAEPGEAGRRHQDQSAIASAAEPGEAGRRHQDQSAIASAAEPGEAGRRHRD